MFEHTYVATMITKEGSPIRVEGLSYEQVEDLYDCMCADTIWQAVLYSDVNSKVPSKVEIIDCRNIVAITVNKEG